MPQLNMYTFYCGHRSGSFELIAELQTLPKDHNSSTHSWKILTSTASREKKNGETLLECCKLYKLFHTYQKVHQFCGCNAGRLIQISNNFSNIPAAALWKLAC